MSEQPQMPASPMTPIAASAVGIHEMFQALVEAGFTETQALFLVSQMLRPQAQA